MSHFFESMIVDDQRDMVLKNLSNKKASDCIKSDHNILICKFSIKCPKREIKVRREVFDFKSEINRKKFEDETSTTNDLSTCFNSNNFESSCNTFFKQLNRKFHKCFNKIRITTGRHKAAGNPHIQVLLHAQSESNNLQKSIK